MSAKRQEVRRKEREESKITKTLPYSLPAYRNAKERREVRKAARRMMSEKKEALESHE